MLPQRYRPAASGVQQEPAAKARWRVAATADDVAAAAAEGEPISSGSTAPSLPVQRALGLDYGRRVVGLAVSTLGLAPRPLPGLPGCTLDGQAALAAEVLQIAAREGCDAVVVGLPVTQGGSLRRRDTDSQQGRRCRNFAQNLAAAAQEAGARVHVFLADERGSTMEAQQVLASSGRRRAAHSKMKDSVAAAVILDSFFEDQAAAVRVRPFRSQAGGGGAQRRQGGQPGAAEPQKPPADAAG